MKKKINKNKTVAGRRSKTRERADRLSVHQANDEQNPRPDGFDSRAEEKKLLEAVRIQRGVVFRLIETFKCVRLATIYYIILCIIITQKIISISTALAINIIIIRTDCLLNILLYNYLLTYLPVCGQIV